jgi:hypothetical protein
VGVVLGVPCHVDIVRFQNRVDTYVCHGLPCPQSSV